MSQMVLWVHPTIKKQVCSRERVQTTLHRKSKECETDIFKTYPLTSAQLQLTVAMVQIYALQLGEVCACATLACECAFNRALRPLIKI